MSRVHEESPMFVIGETNQGLVGREPVFKISRVEGST